MKKIIIALVLCLALVSLIAVPATARKGPYFSTRITSDDDPLPGMLESHFIYNTEGIPGKFHYLGLTDTKTNLELISNLYEFKLDANAEQKTILKDYFTAKLGGTLPPCVEGMIEGDLAFFLYDSANDMLIDGFEYNCEGKIEQLRIDDDYPVGEYVYNGVLTGSLNDKDEELPVTVTLKVMRWDTGFSNE